MKTLNISLTEKDIKRFGIQSDNLSFQDLQEKFKVVFAREAFEKCHDAAKKSGLDQMTFKEIQSEVKAVRNTKNNS